MNEIIPETQQADRPAGILREDLGYAVFERERDGDRRDV